MHLVIHFSIIFGLVIGYSSTKLTDRTWKPNLNFNNSANWDGGRKPCAADRLVLQNTESIVLEMPKDTTSLRALVLPLYTELVLPTAGAVVFTGKTYMHGCEGKDMVFKPTSAGKWTDSDNWDGWTKATPDLERIPCVQDSVKFPPGGFYKVLMPEYVAIGSIEVNGVNMDSNEWYNYGEGEGRKQFFRSDKSPADVQISGHPCEQNQWCSCGNNYLRSQICIGDCATPLCKSPVKPAGFCCPICGVYFLLDTTSKLDKKSGLEKQIMKFMQNQNEIAWHISFDGSSIQVVLVEEGEYSGQILEIAEQLKKSLLNDKMGWITKEYHASGHVWYPTTIGQIIKRFFSLLVIAVLVIASIMTVFSQNWTWFHSLSLENRLFLLARYENLSGEVVVTGELAPEPPVPSGNNTFDNPMYGATAQDERKVTVTNPMYAEVEECTSEDLQTEMAMINSSESQSVD